MNYSALICITTCNRLNEVKKYILPYINFCNSNSSFSFLLSLDGNNAEYIDFCRDFEIPLLYSEEREGVGLSKNRVLTQFPDFDYYFFIEDDIELLDSGAFDLFVNTYLATGYHHFTFSHPHNPTKVENKNNVTLIHNNFGGGQINFYTKMGIKQVGGWHTYFAKYKRFGHTEHTYRFYHAGLVPSPFIFIKEARDMFIVHDPPHVTKIDLVLENPINELIPEEEKMIEEKKVYFPISILSACKFNGFDMKFSGKVATFLVENPKRYPLLKGRERRICFSEYYFFMFNSSNSVLNKFGYFCMSFFLYPFNNRIKHYIKQLLRLV